MQSTHPHTDTTSYGLDDVLTEQIFSYFLTRPQELQATRKTEIPVIQRVRKAGISYPLNGPQSGSTLAALLMKSRTDVDNNEEHISTTLSHNSLSQNSLGNDETDMVIDSVSYTCSNYAVVLTDSSAVTSAQDSMFNSLRQSPGVAPNTEPSSFYSSKTNLYTNTNNNFITSNYPTTLSMSPEASLYRSAGSKLEELLSRPTLQKDEYFHRPMNQRSVHLRKLIAADRNPRRASTGSLPAQQMLKSISLKSHSPTRCESRQKVVERKRAPFVTQRLSEEVLSNEEVRGGFNLRPLNSSVSEPYSGVYQQPRKMKSNEFYIQPQSVKSIEEGVYQRSLIIPQEFNFSSKTTNITGAMRKLSGESSTSYMDDETQQIPDIKPDLGYSNQTAVRRASHITSEQKRRRSINEGFDLLDALSSAAAGKPAGRTSRAAILKKGAEMCRKLNNDLSLMEDESRCLRNEIDSLSSDLRSLQLQLPAGGASTSRCTIERMMLELDDYISYKAAENWKYLIFSLIIKKLFSSYLQLCSSVSVVDWRNEVLRWLDEFCSLSSLRPIVNQTVFELSKNTSILSDPTMLADELHLLTTQNHNPINLSENGF